MLGLLAGELRPKESLSLPGTAPTRDEQEQWKTLVQKNLLLGILSQWEKELRTREKKEEDKANGLQGR